MPVGIDVEAVAGQINGAIDQSVGEFLLEIQETIHRAYEVLVYRSPIWTGYYASNHSIVIRSATGQFKTQGARLSPGVKTSNKRFIYEDNIEGRMADELVKVTEIALGDRIGIMTIVPYAEDVEAKHQVYERVAADFGLE